MATLSEKLQWQDVLMTFLALAASNKRSPPSPWIVMIILINAWASKRIFTVSCFPQIRHYIVNSFIRVFPKCDNTWHIQYKNKNNNDWLWYCNIIRVWHDDITKVNDIAKTFKIWHQESYINNCTNVDPGFALQAPQFDNHAKKGWSWKVTNRFIRLC